MKMNSKNITDAHIRDLLVKYRIDNDHLGIANCENALGANVLGLTKKIRQRARVRCAQALNELSKKTGA